MATTFPQDFVDFKNHPTERGGGKASDWGQPGTLPFLPEGWPKTPFVTIALIVINCIGFLFTLSLANWKFVSGENNFMLGPSVQDLIDSGGLISVSVICDSQWWRIFVSCFLHAGLLHISTNMVLLWVLGSQLEREFGPYDMLMIYLPSGIAGQLASAIFLPNSVSVGASGAIFGLVGAQWADYLQNYAFFHELDKLAFGGISGCLYLTITTVFLVGYSIVPSVNAFAHCFGLVTGSLMGYVVLIRRRKRKNEIGEFLNGENGHDKLEPRTYGQKFRVALAMCAILIELLIFSILFGLDNVYEDCEYCKYVQCFETYAWDCDDYMVATCSFEPFANDNACTALDANFEGDDCVVITCLDDSTHAFDSGSEPTSADCYAVCGPDHSHCTDEDAREGR